MRLVRIAVVGFLSVGIAWGCGSSGDSDEDGSNLEADASAGNGGSSTGGSGGDGTGGSAGSAGSTAGGGSGGSAASAGSAGAGPDDGGLDGAFGAPPVDQCTPTGSACGNGSECCSDLCNPATNICEPAPCRAAGGACDSPDDCCNLRCESGSCAATQCTDDGAACAGDGECCGGVCNGGTCAPLNPLCKTAGNSCGGDGECCSHFCNAGVCDADISWCRQTGDICSSSEQCCSGRCAIPTGSNFGVCDPIASGAGCSGKLAEGEACSGFGNCAECCSKLCTPDPRSGRFVCAPTLGCKTEGALCRQHTDCCGYEGSDLPGDGNGECIFEFGASVGFCKTTSCIPQGQVCKYEGDNPDYICDQPTQDPNNCCGAVGNSGRCIDVGGQLLCNGFEPCKAGLQEGDSCSFCQVDTLGIPRCNGLTECRQPGETCSSAADCCNQVPCVPDSEGILRCLYLPDGGPQCVPEGDACSGDADCCEGLICIKSPGSVIGYCGNEGPPPGDAGPPPEGGTPPTQCSAYGQRCSAREDCCNYDISPDYGCFDNVCKLQPN